MPWLGVWSTGHTHSLFPDPRAEMPRPISAGLLPGAAEEGWLGVRVTTCLADHLPGAAGTGCSSYCFILP